MSNLTHVFKVGQKVKCRMDYSFYNGTVTETHEDYILVDIPGISDHVTFEQNFNLDCVYPIYNFKEGGMLV